MARLEQTVRIFLEAYDVQMWGDSIGLDLEYKPQWGTYYYDNCHHGEPGHISKNLRITLHPDISLVTRNPAITHRSEFISLGPWSSRHEYQDYCHHGERGHIKQIRYMTGWQD